MRCFYSFRFLLAPRYAYYYYGLQKTTKGKTGLKREEEKKVRKVPRRETNEKKRKTLEEQCLKLWASRSVPAWKQRAVS